MTAASRAHELGRPACVARLHLDRRLLHLSVPARLERSELQPAAPNSRGHRGQELRRTEWAPRALRHHFGGVQGEVTLWSRNLTDEDHIVNYIDFSQLFGNLTDAYYLEPRTYGLKAEHAIKW